MINFQELLKDPMISTWVQDVRIGLEKESQRVTEDGYLATTDHPTVLGNRSFHATIQTDYSETQVEMITPVLNSPQESVDYLGALHEVVERSIPENEMIWPLSMPPELPENEEEIRIAKLERFEEVLYRRYLAKAYGKRKQMVSGIHYNFEFRPEFVDLVASNNPTQSKDEVRNAIYLHVAQNYLRYRWLITYLYGASPVAETGYFVDRDEQPTHLVRSLRNSAYGYTNNPDVNVSFSSLENYCQDIDSLVEKGILSEEKEFYAPVRLRGGKRVADLSAHGIHYLEIRNIDLNPFADYGIDVDELRFLHLYVMLMLWLPTPEKIDTEVEFGTELNNQVALENPLSETSLVVEGVWLFDELEKMALVVNLSEEDRQLIYDQRQKFINPEKTLSGQLALHYSSGETQHEFALSRAEFVKEKSTRHPYQLEGFRDMELSTQIMLFDALQTGLKTEVLDRDDQFIRLSFEAHSELVKNGNMTSKDNYIVPLAMANKVVTKQLLAEKGYRVPEGHSFQRLEDAKKSFNQYATKGFVVKPKSTNYGIGISIFKNGATEEDYNQALKIAFDNDSEVIVEEYLEGTEYRFCVIGGKTRAIMLRRPANVTGDGIKTIEELVSDKNKDPLRGTDHRSPLEIILLGEIERLMLKEQGVTPQTIVEEGRIVYLRENSNVSTGGDSVDMTNYFDESYKQLAEEAVASLGAEICGIDFIIPDKSLPTSKESDNYGILEANFNPAMHMHAYPFAGEGQRLTQDVINLLFPELHFEDQ